MKSVIRPILLTLSSKKYVLIAGALTLAMAFLALLVPVLLTPSNSFGLQLSLLTANHIALIILFSLLFGLSIAMQLYASSKEKIRKNELVAKGAGTGVVAFIGTLFSAKLCPVCIGAILGYLGIGGSAAFFLFNYETEILVVTIVVLGLIIVLTGRRIETCEKCNIKNGKKSK